MTLAIRDMTPTDWPRVAEIYRMGIETGMATFETAVPAWEAFDASRLPSPRLIAQAEEIAGWATLSPYSRRAVYRGVAELSVYVHATYRGRGVGRALLDALCARAEDEGIWTLQACVSEENEASLRLHRAAGFRTVGVREKLAQDAQGAWRDVVLLERRNGIR